MPAAGLATRHACSNVLPSLTPTSQSQHLPAAAPSPLALQAPNFCFATVPSSLPISPFTSVYNLSTAQPPACRLGALSSSMRCWCKLLLNKGAFSVKVWHVWHAHACVQCVSQLVGPGRPGLGRQVDRKQR